MGDTPPPFTIIMHEAPQTFCRIGWPRICLILHWNHTNSLMARDTAQTRHLPLYKRLLRELGVVCWFSMVVVVVRGQAS